MLRILLADDHTFVRQGLRRIIEEREDWRVVAEASNGREAVRMAEECDPDLAILDITMPVLNGIEATGQIVKRSSHVRVLILSMHAEEALITRAVQAGAHGYLIKDSADTDIVTAIEALSSGKSFFSPAAARTMLDDYRRVLAARGVTDRYDTLSEREREVLQLMAEGHSNKSIADILCISPSTVDTHRGHVMEKLDLHSIAEIVLFAVRRGIIT